MSPGFVLIWIFVSYMPRTWFCNFSFSFQFFALYYIFEHICVSLEEERYTSEILIVFMLVYFYVFHIYWLFINFFIFIFSSAFAVFISSHSYCRNEFSKVLILFLSFLIFVLI